MPDEGIYAPPRHVTDIGECSFYHVTDLPGHGVVGWGWDLRGGEEKYLGGVEVRGKRVLELGTSSGFLCRYMESKGADVVGYDLSDEYTWDFVPYSQCDMSSYLLEMKNYLRLQNNAWWFAHRLFRSTAKVVYGHVYEIPEQIGTVDVSTFGSLLLHVRDPFLALQNALRLTRESVVTTDLHPEQPGDSPFHSGGARSPPGPRDEVRAGFQGRQAGHQLDLVGALPRAGGRVSRGARLRKNRGERPFPEVSRRPRTASH